MELYENHHIRNELVTQARIHHRFLIVFIGRTRLKAHILHYSQSLLVSNNLSVSEWALWWLITYVYGPDYILKTHNLAMMTAGNGSSHGEIEVDGMMQTLSNAVRREIIRYFENQPAGATVSLEELVTHIKQQNSTKTIEGVWKMLYLVHLPTLQSRGWLDFDPEREMVSYHGHDEAEQLIEDIYEIFQD